jgi:hypothetical protein
MRQIGANVALAGLMVMLVACQSAAGAGDSQAGADASQLYGTWDYQFEGDDLTAIKDELGEGIGSPDKVAVRVGFYRATWWQGFVFDGTLFMINGVPEGDGGTYELVDGTLVMVGADGTAGVTYDWALDGDALTLKVLEECDTSGPSPECNTDRGTIDPSLLLVTEHTYTRSSDRPAY